MSGDQFDVIVVGAGPAGATTANILAQNEASVALVDREAFPRSGTSLGWVNARVGPLLGELGVKDKSLLSRPIREVTFHNADFTKSAKPAFDGLAGFLVDTVEYGNALVEAASKREVTVATGVAVADLKLKETSAQLILRKADTLEGRLLVLAPGSGSDLLDRAGFTREGRNTAIWTAQVDGSSKVAADADESRVAIVLGLDKPGSFGVCCIAAERVSVAINWLGEREEALPALVHLCKVVFESKVVPIDLAEHARGATRWPSPAAVALDVDTHVGKHALVVGDAGGFVAAAGNEGIYPAMWSGQIAAEVILAALESECSQDELMAFDSQWRMAMADYLRSPNTDNQFLLPLVFSNQPMADRMGAAFFAGENI